MGDIRDEVNRVGNTGSSRVFGIPTDEFEAYLKGADYLTKLIGGITAGKASAADRERQKQLDAEALRVAQYNREAIARGNIADLYQSQLTDQTNRAKALSAAMPLGSEQTYAQLQGLAGNFGRQMAGMALPTAYGGTVNPFAGMDLSAFSPEAISASLADRRKVLSNIEPGMQFSPMSSYGLGGSPAEQQAVEYAQKIAQQRAEQQANVQKLLEEQMAAAKGYGQPTTPAADQTATPEKKKTSLWKKIAKVGLAVTTPVVAAATGGLGLPAMMALGAATGAGSSALSGSGVKGILTGAAMGAGTSALGAKLPVPGGTTAPNIASTAGQRIQQAVLNPATLARMASAGTSGTTSNVLGAISPFLGTRPILPTTSRSYMNSVLSPPSYTRPSYSNPGLVS